MPRKPAKKKPVARHSSAALGVALLLLAATPAAGAPVHYEWTRLDSPSLSGLYRVVGGESARDFWVSATDGNLHHHRAGHWTTLPPHPEMASHQVWHVVSEAGTLAVSVDRAYHTRAWRLQGGRWTSEGKIADVPVRWFQRGAGRLWLHGDWGALFVREQNRWRRIETPFDNHILSFASAPSGVCWLGVRSEGLWELRQGRFRKLEPGVGAATDITGLLLESDSTGWIYLASGRLYRFSEGEAVPVPTSVTVEGGRRILRHPEGGFYFSRLAAGGGFSSELPVWRGEGWRFVSIPFVGRLQVARVFPDRSLLAGFQDGTLLLGRLRQGLHFYDRTASARLEGSTADHSLAGALPDMEEDGDPDLFVLNRGEGSYNRLYLNLGEGIYTEATRASGLLATRGASHVCFGDVTGDGRLDATAARALPGRVVVRTWTGDGRGRFRSAGATAELAYEEEPRDMDLADVDGDGDLDLLLCFYYGEGRGRRGRTEVLENRRWGRWTPLPREKSRGLAVDAWHQAALFGDFTGDGRLDLYVANQWLLDRLLINTGDGYRNEYGARISTLDTSRTGDVAAFDLEPDGDLDLLRVRAGRPLQLLRNDGTGRFEDASGLLGDVQLSGERLAVGDLDHDGYTDLLLLGMNESGEAVYRVLAGRGSGGFEELEGRAGLPERERGVGPILLADSDRDGDLDLHVLLSGLNRYYENQLDDGRSIRLRLESAGGGGAGLHAGYRLYDAGHAGDPARLRASGQRGVGLASLPAAWPEVHMGTGQGEGFDLVVRFSSGAERRVRAVRPGDVVTVREHPAPLLAWMRLPARAAGVLGKPQVQFTLVAALLALLLLYASLQLGHRHFQWSARTLVALALVNLSAFWIVLQAAEAAPLPLGQLIALAVVAGGVGLPLFAAWSQRRLAEAATGERKRQALVGLLLVFSHGDWALSNLNSIRRLGSHVLTTGDPGERSLQQLRERANTFLEMTAPNLEKLEEAAAGLEEVKPDLQRLRQHRRSLLALLAPVARGELPAGSRVEAATRLAQDVERIRDALRSLKDQLFRNWSCDAAAVARSTVQALEEQFLEAGLPAPELELKEEEAWALIRSWELADVLDNSLRNALEAMRSRADGHVRIGLERRGAKLVIEVEDTGEGLPESLRERIFEEGYSGRGSTGRGLPQARRVLESYGGAIRVTDGAPGQGTTFQILLNEGRRP